MFKREVFMMKIKKWLLMVVLMFCTFIFGLLLSAIYYLNEDAIFSLLQALGSFVASLVALVISIQK